MFLSKANEFYTMQHGKVVGSAETGEERTRYLVSSGQGKGRTRLSWKIWSVERRRKWLIIQESKRASEKVQYNKREKERKKKRGIMEPHKQH